MEGHDNYKINNDTTINNTVLRFRSLLCPLRFVNSFSFNELTYTSREFCAKSSVNRVYFLTGFSVRSTKQQINFKLNIDYWAY